MKQTITIDGVEIYIEGSGDETVLMLHGWPDTYRLWDPQVEALKDRYRCVRFSLPGFEKGQPRNYFDLAALVAFIDKVVDAVSDGKPLTLMLHDWGCVFGYQFYLNHQQKVKRIIGVDIGDAGSPDVELSTKAKMMMLSYQLFLMAAWNIGGKVGDWMTQKTAAFFNAPAPADMVHSGMTYPYHWRWSTALKRKPLGMKPLEIEVPFLFLYGGAKLGNFHSKVWEDKMAAIPGNRIVNLPTHHWVMVEEPDAFNQAVIEWLGETDSPSEESAA